MNIISHNFHYNFDLIGGSLMVRESRIVAELLLAGVDDAAWKAAILDKNRLQKARPATARRRRSANGLYGFLRRSGGALSEEDDQLATQVAFCAALARNLLLVEFLETVVAGAVVTQAERLEPYQWDDFLADRAYRDPAITGWTASSRRKMGQVAFRMLSEVGLLDNARSRRLQPLTLTA
ncbi:BrxA family protein [Halomonas sp. BM-2019]|uniref:BrxA family protein n=1 Tax=Halomonas sp. BM-2019 TaxID=2811227 RepID=UPI001B3C3D86|nr:MAG: DUF1819 family protein [Halomonas sp. BM-2019]